MVHCFCLLLLCVSLSQLSDCLPSFTQSPNSSNPTYVAEGAGFVTLAWNYMYNADRFTLLHVDLLYVKPGPRTVVVARKAPGQNLIVYSSSGYTGRISFSDRATFQISNIVQSDSKTFQCRLSFSDSDPPEYQQNAEVVVVVPPSIQSSTQSPVEVKEGNPFTLLCVASGNPKPSYTWTKESATVQQTSNSNYTITSANKDHAGTYTCTARVTAPTVNTNPASYTVTVTVKFKPQVTALYPNQTALNDGSNAFFTCEAVAYPTSIEYLWFKDGRQITSDANGDYAIQPSGSGSILTVNQIKKNSAGRYSCSGRNSEGTGIQAFVYFKVNYAPENVTVTSTNPQCVKEGQSATLTCYADGYPLPSFSWKFNGNPVTGAQQKTRVLTNARVNDAGNYTCVAKNVYGSKEFTREVHVRYPPKITRLPQDSYTVSETNNVTMECGGDGVPVPDIIWVKTSSDKEVGRGEHFTIVNTSGSDDGTYKCTARNELGSDSKEVTLNVQNPPKITRLPQDSYTVSETNNVTMVCGGDGVPVPDIIWVKTSSDKEVGRGELFTIVNTSGSNDGTYKCTARNELGSDSKEVTLNVQNSPVPPDRGTVKATRSSDEPTVIVVTWTVADKKVTKLSLDMQERGNSVAKREVIEWTPVPGAQDMSINKTEFKVENLKSDKQYTFRMDMRRQGEEDLASCPDCYVYSSTVPVGPIPGQRGDDEGLQNWIIPVIAAVAGVLLLCIVILCLCCFMRRKKAHGADRVDMSKTNTSSYVVGGPDVSRSLDSRLRSFGMKSLEDDPFIEAYFASMQSMNSSDGKKKPANGVNYGYLSQDSVQNQPEMLLDPGSRFSRNHPVAQSTGDLGMGILAMRQSGRKPKTRKSTRDLAGPGQGRHSGGRPRQTPSDEPTDSSDGEARFTPQRAAPPPPSVRHLQSSGDDPGYAAVDQGRVVGPRVLPQRLPSAVVSRSNGPLDPTVHYALPQKKKSKKSRSEPSGPAIGPPPQYTSEDRSPEERIPHPRDLDLDDPSTLPSSERPPGLPPPMAMLPSNRSRPSYHDDLQPPAFLRDVVYPADGRDPRYDSDEPAFYQPPSPQPNRQRQPYVNIRGQLVRPSSRSLLPRGSC